MNTIYIEHTIADGILRDAVLLILIKGGDFLSFKLKKSVSFLLALIMALSLAGCGNDEAKTVTEPSDTKADEPGGIVDMPTEEERTTQEDIDDNPELPGGEQEIATEVVLSTEATTETTTEATTDALSGKYSYTIYGGIQVSLDTNVDDYIIVDDEGLPFFKLYDVATELGWNCENDAYSQYTYDCGDYVTYFNYWHNEVQIENGSAFDYYYQISRIEYKFITSFIRGEVWEDYYDDADDNHKYLSVRIANHYDKIQYCVPGSAVMSRDDIILVTYLLESVKHHPGENPFCFIDASDYQVRNTESGMNYELP